MKALMKITLVGFGLIVAGLLAVRTAAGSAQPIDNLIYTAGTTTIDAQSRSWAYLLWQATTPDLVRDKAFAIYAKSGDANSAALYQRKAVVRIQTDPALIDALLKRSVNLGENLPLLEERLDNLFQKLKLPPAASLADKLSIVIRSALDNPEHFKSLILISRVHPGVSMSIGFAYADLIPNAGQTTFEIRQYDVAKDLDIGVVGRVSVAAGAPTVLPAPGAAVQVPDVPVTSAKGDLNAKFRWVAPDALRRLSLLGYGFNLYRMTRSYAEQHNYHLNPPSLGLLAQLAQQNLNNLTNPPVKRVNEPPILTSADFTAANVANFDPQNGGDNSTYFTHDDNRRYEPGGAPFANGDQFYYFVTARDILNRDGLSSAGTLVTMCDRLPPEAPRDLAVENDYSKQPNQSAQQVFRITWRQNTNTPSETHTFYYVYRWTNHSDYLKDTLDPVNHPNRVGVPIAQDPGKEKLSILDTGVGAPHMPQDAGKTFWYTVRVRDNSACGGNFSPHSGPIFGVLRQREGPGSPNGLLGITCCKPAVASAPNHDSGFPNSDSSRAYFRPFCIRLSPVIEWAEFYAFDFAQSNLLTRAYFPNGIDAVRTVYSIARSSLVNTQLAFFCRVGSTDGKVSVFALNTPGAPSAESIRQVDFTADLDCQRVIVGANGSEVCGTHQSNPSGNGTNNCIDIFVGLAAGTKEVKLYKRVDLGALMLIDQGKNGTNSQIYFQDCTPLANPADLCYFAQAFDENGNASALAPIGTCIKLSGATKLAKPLLSPLSPAGSSGGPLMDIAWFCPPYGIDRFEVSIAVADNSTMPNQISPMLLPLVRVDPAVDFKIEGKPKKNDFNVYQTITVGPNFGEGAKFRVTVAIELGKTYDVFVRAIGKDGLTGEHGNAEEFTWSDPLVPGPQVPWPARPLPPIFPVFDAQLAATNLPSAAYPVGIRIGAKLPVLSFTESTNGNSAVLQNFITPLSYLFAKKSGATVLPVALYRYQVTNANFPVVSGDVTQVSPLMEKIAFQQTTQAPYGAVTILRDPFVGVFQNGSTPFGSPIYDLYLLDTQPVVTGARYGYLLVRFGDNREIEEVIPTNEVEL
jgi:hypothetical protein